MGLTALPLSPDYGGFGGGAVDLMGVMEAFGEALVVEPLVPTLLGALLVAKGGSAEQKQAILPAVAEGRMKLAFAHSEPGSRYDLSAVKTRRRRQGRRREERRARRADGRQARGFGAGRRTVPRRSG